MNTENNNDAKEKQATWITEIEESGSDLFGSFDSKIIGYGQTEYESKINAVKEINNLIKNLKRIKDEIIED